MRDRVASDMQTRADGGSCMPMLYIIVLRNLNSAGILRNHRERILFKQGEFCIRYTKHLLKH